MPYHYETGKMSTNANSELFLGGGNPVSTPINQSWRNTACKTAPVACSAHHFHLHQYIGAKSELITCQAKMHVVVNKFK